MNAETMTCPRCGATMNCHAEKLVEPQTADEAARVMVVEEIHQCPRCGLVASRRLVAS